MKRNVVFAALLLTGSDVFYGQYMCKSPDIGTYVSCKVLKFPFEYDGCYPFGQFLPDPADRKMLAASSGDVRIGSAAAYRLKGIWSASRREF